MGPSDTELLRLAANRAGRRPAFLAHDLTRSREVLKGDPAEWLSLSEEQMDRLALCRTPRRGTHFGHDVLAIAGHLQADPVALAGLLRLNEVVRQIRLSTDELPQVALKTPAPGLLAAARDDADEHTVLGEELVGDPGLPGWLRNAVDRFWAEAPIGSTFPRDLDFAVLAGMPLAVVELPQLTAGAIQEWLTTHDLELVLRISSRDSRLRACLVALGGVGLIFVDADDDATQRRVSLAHEAGHFLVEYLLPRQEVARRRPELLEVVDGQRHATSKERLSATLGDVPIGIHTHLIGRASDGSGGEQIDLVEWRARRVALELLAPQDMVLMRLSEEAVTDSTGIRNVLVEQFGLPVSLAADYADQLMALVGPPPHGLLDVLDRRRARRGPGYQRRTSNETHGRTSDSGPE